MGNNSSRCILDLTNEEAFYFFLRPEHYCSIELPTYFNFSNLLSHLNNSVGEKSFFDTKKMKQSKNVNYTLLQNKDGNLGWRNIQIINPLSYILLTREITHKENWEFILTRFKEFQKNPNITCVSLPVLSLSEERDRAEVIKKWWSNFEQQSISLSLSYNYIYKTDIANCYDSIYTHSIAWALHTKETAKRDRNKKELIGNSIDRNIQSMQYGQTNGIPQGSTLMDFIAEMVLGYIDLELSEAIEKEKITEYKILRYRDDYRVFVNNPIEGEKIFKILSEKAFDVGLRFNTAKTNYSKDIISSSIKEDKLSWITSYKFNRDIQKQLLILRNHLLQYPNSGVIIKELVNVYKRIYGKKDIIPEPLISIITDMAYNNPNIHTSCAAIISLLLACEEYTSKKIELINKIHTKFMHRPNSGHMLVWLQRLSLPFDKTIEYEEKLCKAVFNNNTKIWNTDWIENKTIINIIESTPIIDNSNIEKIEDIIRLKEFELFIYRRLKNAY